jgi:hypothetical protein
MVMEKYGSSEVQPDFEFDYQPSNKSNAKAEEEIMSSAVHEPITAETIQAAVNRMNKGEKDFTLGKLVAQHGVGDNIYIGYNAELDAQAAKILNFESTIGVHALSPEETALAQRILKGETPQSDLGLKGEETSENLTDDRVGIWHGFHGTERLLEYKDGEKDSEIE